MCRIYIVNYREKNILQKPERPKNAKFVSLEECCFLNVVFLYLVPAF